MPKLTDFRQTKIVSLPSFPDSKVEIYDSILVKDAKSLSFEGKDPIKHILEALPLFIKSWNFTDEKDQPMPITKENLDFLRIEDLQLLADEIKKFSDEGKKK